MSINSFYKLIIVVLLISILSIRLAGQIHFKNDEDPVNRILAVKELVALWTFTEEPGNDRKSMGPEAFSLKESGVEISRTNEGPLSGYSIVLDGTNYLSIPNSQTGMLNIYGDKCELTVIAWIKWTGEQTGFIGGMWNESQDGGKRQYGLFVSLPWYNGGDQVCGHVSKTGRATPPFPYSIDYSASKQKVPEEEWCCVAFTYDGRFIRSYLNGIFEPREPELISNTTGFPGYPDGLVQTKNPYYFPYGTGNNGSDFTVGAVQLRSGMGNYFKGLLGGLAVYNRALTPKEIRVLYNNK